MNLITKRIKGKDMQMKIFFFHKACPNGYYWINCSRPCQYPRFGTRCGQICICEKDNCDHMSGCKKGRYFETIIADTLQSFISTQRQSNNLKSVYSKKICL